MKPAIGCLNSFSKLEISKSMDWPFFRNLETVRFQESIDLGDQKFSTKNFENATIITDFSSYLIELIF